jgi:copper chaperone CopZ
MQIQLKISGMHCLDCAVKVSNDLVETAGVESADVKYVRKLATVEVGQPVAVETLVEAVKKAGYGAEPA